MRLIIIFCLLSFWSGRVHGQEAFHKTVQLMGCRFDITVVAEDQISGDQFIDLAVSEIRRIENLISSWDPNSQTSKIISQSGASTVTVDQELFDLIERSLAISQLTDGAFDITYASMDRIWKFDGSMTSMPSQEAIQHSVRRVGHENILLDKSNRSVYLKKKDMKIGFGAIGKGYAADKAKTLLISKGVQAGIINASGDLTTWGQKPDGTDWKVAITHPLNKDKVFAMMPIRDGAVVTSGNYEKYVNFNGKRYTHIIDPRTGYPSSGILSVSVFAKSAELADALATSIFVMGKDVGLHLIDQLDQIECIIVDDEHRVSKSKGIQLDHEG